MSYVNIPGVIYENGTFAFSNEIKLNDILYIKNANLLNRCYSGNSNFEPQYVTVIMKTPTDITVVDSRGHIIVIDIKNYVFVSTIGESIDSSIKIDAALNNINDINENGSHLFIKVEDIKDEDKIDVRFTDNIFKTRYIFVDNDKNTYIAGLTNEVHNNGEYEWVKLIPTVCGDNKLISAKEFKDKISSVLTMDLTNFTLNNVDFADFIVTHKESRRTVTEHELTIFAKVTVEDLTNFFNKEE